MEIGNTLLVSADPVTIQQFSHALQEWSISPDVCREVPAAVGLLNRRKFDAVIGSDTEGTAFRKTSEFVFERPLSAKSIRSTLRPAYGLILRERRRYFRCPLAIPVAILRRAKPDVRCSSVNISEGGMTLSTFVPVSPGEKVNVEFNLAGHEVPFLAESMICWLKTGQIGLRFVSFRKSTSPS